MGDALDESAGYRLGVDVGGTFTDVCVVTPHGETVRAKALSTSPNQSVGVKQAIDKVRDRLRAEYGWSGKFDYIHHGTTIATNAILEGKGSKAALVVTAGHKDILHLRRSQIPGSLGAWLQWKTPQPVIPLELTVDAPERVAIDGTIVTPLDEEQLRANMAPLKQAQPSVVSVSLINAFANDAHEQAVARVLREELPAAEIVLSSAVLPEVGEYERTVTTAANALVKPIIKRYVSHLSRILADDTSTIRILKSDGGLTSLPVAEELPVNLLMSGPAGGVHGVCHAVARAYPNVITIDVGGTSSDCAIIADGVPAVRRETAIGALSVKAPSIDVHTVGAGGGSIAQYNTLSKSLRVGPESAGAVPGPACYGKGGTQPTVTDANLVLGYLPSTLLGGEFQLDVAAAFAAVGALAGQMGVSVEEAAQGIVDLANETMYGAVRLVSVEQGHDPRDFALVVFGGGGPLHANAVGELLRSWPVLVPPAPGILCAQGDVVTKLSHEKTASFIRRLQDVSLPACRALFAALEAECRAKLYPADTPAALRRIQTVYKVDLRYMGQAQEMTVALDAALLRDATTTADAVAAVLRDKFEAEHRRHFAFVMPQFAIELIRLRVIAIDDAPDVQIGHPAADDVERAAPEAAVLDRKTIYHRGARLDDAVVWDRHKISTPGTVVRGPCVISEMDSNTLVLPGYRAKIDSRRNIVITPDDGAARAGSQAAADVQTMDAAAAQAYVARTPIVPTLIESALSSVRREMDTLMLRAAMSPAIREQQDEFNVVTTADGQMLVGQFGSFIPDFLHVYKGPVEDGDVYITNDVYSMGGAVSHLNDVILLVPIFFQGALVGWAANFGHLTDVQGRTPGSLSIDARTIFDDGLQIPVLRLYKKGVMNEELLQLMCKNSRTAEWFQADIFALISACSTARRRIEELCERFGVEVYKAAAHVLLERNKLAVSQIIDTVISDEPAAFTDFIDDDGHGNGPFALKCVMQKKDGCLHFDWDGTSPQSEYSINYMLSHNLFIMYIVYYLMAVMSPYTLVNGGANELIKVRIPKGCILNPVYPAALSCRTHLLGRIFDVIQAMLGQHMPGHRAAAGFSDSPHLFYSGFKPDGAFFLLYQIGFGGVPARPVGDGLDCHCLFPAIKSIPIETIELYFPLRIDQNIALPDSGGAGFYRGGNAQKTLYRFLSAGDVNVHDDRAYTVAWGCDGGMPGSRSRKILVQYSVDPAHPPRIQLGSKQDHIRVAPGDVLEWITWGGGGIGDPLTRPVAAVQADVQRRLATVDGVRQNYGVVLDPATLAVDAAQTTALRAQITATRAPYPASRGTGSLRCNRGGTLAELAQSFTEETGLPAPKPQWETDPYGPHVTLPYVQNWYKTMREKKGWGEL